MLLGRDSELARMDAAVRAALAGQGFVAFIAGEPGVGKTRLAAAAAASAEAAGMRVLWGRCREEGGTPAHWPWVQVLRALAQETEPARLAAAAGRGAPFLAAAVPELADRLKPERGISSAAASSRFAFFDAVETLLRGLSASAPLLLVFDDLHAADPSSLALLGFIAPELFRSRTLLLATYREHEASQNEAGPVIAQAVRFGERIRLGGLGAGDVETLAAETAGHAVSPRLVAAVHRATEGNPLFVQEMVRTLAARGRLGDAEDLRYLELADSVQYVIATRLEPLSRAARDVLSAAAVIGRSFDVATLEAATSVPAYEILTHLQAAVDAGIVSLSGGVRGDAAFAHALYREFFYGGLPASERGLLHLRVAEALEKQNEEARLPEIAFHLLEAGPVGSLARAAEYSTRAGDQAASRLAYEQAVKHYEDAIRALEAGAGAKFERCDLLLRLGDAQFRAGDGMASKASFRQAAEAARAIGDAERLGRAAIGLLGPWSINAGIARDDVVNTLQEALAALGERAPALRTTLLARLAVELCFGDMGRSDGLSEQAVALGRRAGDPRALAEALLARHVTLYAAAPVFLAQGRGLCRGAVRLARQVGADELEFRGRFHLVNHLLEEGDRAAFDREVNAAARLAERLRQPFYRWFVDAWRSAAALVDGRLDDAESLIEHTFASGCQVQAHEEVTQFAAQVYQAQLFTLRVEQGRGLADIEPAFRAMVDSVPLPLMRCCLTRLLCDLERWTEARDEFERVAANGFAELPADWTRLPGIAFSAATCADLADAERAPALYDLALPYALHHIGNGSYYFGSMHHHLARLAAVMRRDGEAAAHFDAALAAHRRMGARCWLARTQVHYAELLLRSGAERDRQRAAAMLREALERARQIGMTGLVATAERVLATAAEPPPEPRAESKGDREPAAPPSSERAVFRREGEMWTIEFAGVARQVSDSRGLQYLQHLLRHPGREFHATELVAMVLGSSGEAARVREGVGAARCATLGDAGPALDAQASAAYRGRLEELRDELAEAEGFDDIGRAARARQEIDFLSAELSTAARGRRSASHGERARLTVTKGIKAAFEKLRRGHPALAQHLEATVRRGYFCSYMPDPRHPILWHVAIPMLLSWAAAALDLV